MSAAETEARLAKWSAAMARLASEAEALQMTAAEARRDPDFTPMRPDFAWAERMIKTVTKLADEIENYR